MSPFVIVDRLGAVAVLTLNRGDHRNALNAPLKRGLLEALCDVRDDPAVRAVVLTGAGSAFSVGQDLNEHARGLADDPRGAFATVLEDYAPIVKALATMPKPAIAAVNGTCVGAGLGLALACDLRVYSESATLGTAFSAIGLTFDSGLSWTLTRAVGDPKARELVLTGATFSPTEAVRWGISGEIVPSEDVVSTAIGQATKLAKGPTLAFAETKSLIAGALGRSLDEALQEEATSQAHCGLTGDHAGAVAAFAAKRTPVFSGS